MKKIIKSYIILNIVCLFALSFIPIYFNFVNVNRLNRLKDLEFNITDQISCQQGIDNIEVDCNYKVKPGIYKIKYTSKSWIFKKSTTRTLKVVDNIKPVITLIGENITIYENEVYQEPGYQAVDNVDKNLTSKVEINSNLDNKNPGTYTIEYNVIDSSGNKSDKISRTITVKAKEEAENISPTLSQKYTSTKTNNKEITKKIETITNYLSSYNISVGYLNLKNNFTYVYKPTKVYFGASLIKTLDALYIYDNSLLTSSTKQNIKDAISVSSNTAHVNLIKKIGIKNLSKYAISLGASKLNCNSKHFCDTTVNDQIIYLNHLYKIINTHEEGDILKSYFINDYGNYLSFDKTYTNLHKYGNSGNFFHDVGIFDTENPYIIVVLTKEKNNGNYRNIIRKVSSLINDLNNSVANNY